MIIAIDIVLLPRTRLRVCLLDESLQHCICYYQCIKYQHSSQLPKRLTDIGQPNPDSPYKEQEPIQESRIVDPYRLEVAEEVGCKRC